MAVTHEIEWKFAVEETFTLPAFDGVRGVASVADRDERHLDAVYYDTDDLRLARNRLTLRRREGGADEGWHLKIPAADGARDEIGRPLGEPSQIPPELLDLVAVRLRGARLRPVVSITTVRRTRRLRDAAGHDLVEVADDRVNARTMGERTIVSRWREVELEVLDPAGVDVLPAASKALHRAGARPSPSPSKLQRALALAVDLGAPDVQPGPARLTAADSAARVVHAYLAEHTAALLDRDPAVRVDAPEAVHDMRVAARRLRSTIQTFRPLFDPERAAAIEAGLREIGDVLGRPRDAEVQLARFAGELAGQPVDLVFGPVAARLQEALLGERLRSREEALAYLRGERYLGFVETLLAFVADAAAGQTERARRPAGTVLAKPVGKADRRLTRRVDRARRATAGSDRDAAYHGARKAAKRLRYACELMIPVHGGAAAKLAREAKRVQDTLGEHQDCVVAQTRLREFAVAANLAGESSFTYGLLAGDERARAAATRAAFDATWAQASRPRHRHWLRG
ncbi:CYTH and CHAD domain-containing protein [Candidatus Frankia alpina]|uniref:CYTH and CHAD domain-containing protein n=1 Tax=Candidatus Frankia alpina TaxID=2699483 RepID=UPI0013D661B9|nr:CYTH and CHAD domain-containing protein [Candidatus Frankia alpina]